MLNRVMTETANKQALKSSVKDEPAFVVGWDRCLTFIIGEAQKKVLNHCNKEVKALKNQEVNPLSPEQKLSYETKVLVCKQIHSLLEGFTAPDDEKDDE